ncbi:uncharacterized protein SCHCODRAFT_01105701, partial [Schizophyllum commune H4-8]|uniref:uncharacterized protein n=1 Tax=Schizophyllum commune (strain H4-8 / FGSC 9210) TaxID=578458 RepID=UPI00215E8C9E
NKLLHVLFPPQGKYVVTPNYLPALDAYGSSEPVVSYEVHIRNGPVLVLQVRPRSHLNIKSQRAAADRQLAQRMLDIQASSPLSIEFYGISAMGTKICFYTYDRVEGLRPAPIPATTVAVDTAPVSRWNEDVLRSSGRRRLRVLVKDIEEGLTSSDSDSSTALSFSSDSDGDSN